jgi:transposase-like protein
MADADILAPHFQDAETAREFLEAKRWPEGPECPHCGIVGEATKFRPYTDTKTHARPGTYKCNACREQFSVTVGTIMEDSHIPLNKWLLAFHLLCASKKGMSAHQLHRMLGVTYKSAWFMAHRIRYAMTQEPLSSKLDGIVEIDECYVGGRRRVKNNPSNTRKPEDPEKKAWDVFHHQHASKGIDPFGGKAAVVALVQRGGKVRSMHVPRVTGETLGAVLDEMVQDGAHVMTDSSTVLDDFTKKRGFLHDKVNHTEKEYVRYEGGLCITTNTIEGVFSILKRGIIGVYHHVGQQHLHRYLTEFDFRYNHREVSDVERRNAAIAGVGGKRLMYRDSCARRTEREAS